MAIDKAEDGVFETQPDADGAFVCDETQQTRRNRCNADIGYCRHDVSTRKHHDQQADELACLDLSPSSQVPSSVRHGMQTLAYDGRQCSKALSIAASQAACR